MIMRCFHNASIRYKLIMLMMLISCTVLGLSAAINLVIETRSEKKQLLENVESMAEIIATNSRNAMVSADNHAATAVLRSLHGVSNISAAYLLNEDGRVFARYLRERDAQGDQESTEAGCPECEPSLRHAHQSIIDGCFYFLHPIGAEGDRVGFLFLQLGLIPLRDQLLTRAGSSMAVFLLSAVAALLLAFILQRLISRPIENLTSAMKLVSEDDDSIPHLEARGTDEVGHLLRVFNIMMERIKSHERRLEEVNQKLEERIRERTGELAAEIDERRRIEASLRMLEKAVETTQVGVTITNLQGEIVYTNPAEAQMHGYTKDELLGKRANILGPPGRREPPVLVDVKTWQRESENIRKDGSLFPVQLISDLVYDAEGQPMGVVTVCEDIAERKKAEERLKSSLDEKEALLKEVHHRVKNNLQIISSLLNLQLKSITEEGTRAELISARSRIRSMALVHERLYQSPDLAHIDFAQYVHEFSRQLFRLYNISPEKIRLNLDIGDIRMDVDFAIPCGMIVNELLTNALKYAFPEGEAGEVWVTFNAREEANVLCIEDNGIGIAGEPDPDNMATLGLQLVSSLSRQLNGIMNIERVGGTRVVISFPGRG